MTHLEDKLESYTVSNKILTLPNCITFVRFLLLPVFFYLLLNSQHIYALVIYAIASMTDFLDGWTARHFNCVTRLGQLMDPALDTLLMISGVVGTYLIGALPLWCMIVIFAREALILCAGGVLLFAYKIRIPVIYLGKVATATLFVGICLLFLNPQIGIWFIYAGIILQILVTIYYFKEAILAIKKTRDQQLED